MGYNYKRGDCVSYKEPLLERCNHTQTGIVTNVFEYNGRPILQVVRLGHSIASQKNLTSQEECSEQFVFTVDHINASKVTNTFFAESSNYSMFLNRIERLYPALVEFVHILRANKLEQQQKAETNKNV